MRVGVLGLLSAVVLAGCSSVPPTAPTPSPAVTPSPSSVASPPSATAPALVSESLGPVSFTRPATWHEVRPSEALVPGPILWLSSAPLSTPCPNAPFFPIGCLSEGRLPDAGVLITFSGGAIAVRSAATPLPIVSLAAGVCTGVGGHGVATRIGITYVSACLHGPLADAAFDAFFRSLNASY